MEGKEQQVNDWIVAIKEIGDSIDKPDCIGFNALHYAIIFKKAFLVKLLLDKGAGS